MRDINAFNAPDRQRSRIRRATSPLPRYQQLPAIATVPFHITCGVDTTLAVAKSPHEHSVARRSVSRILHAMRSFAAIVLVVLSTTAATADSKKPTESTATASPACKRVVVGRGLERHVVCQYETPLIVKVPPPKPNVLMVHRDGRDIVGKPRSTDRLAGLNHHLD
jgi:hypothetical protein